MTTADPLAPMARFEDAYGSAVEVVDVVELATPRQGANDPPDDEPTGEGARLIRIAEVAPERVAWLWPARLPLGKLVTLDGDPALGKSTLILDLAARVSTGSAMPDGAAIPEPAAVILMSAEDGVADTIRPRLDAAGANCERVYAFDSVTYEDEEGRLQSRPPSIPADIDRLEALVREVGAVLVVIDVLNAYLASNVDSYRDQDVRRVLHRLAIVAQRTGATIVALRHLSKSGGGKAIYRGGGSIGIIGAARLGLLVACDPEDESRRVLAVCKSNLAGVPPALAYRLAGDEEHGCARVDWLGEVTLTADELVAPGGTGDDDHADAAAVLAEILADGPVWVKEALDRMGDAGFSKDQAKRAKAKLRARSVKVGKPGDAVSGWQWELRRVHEGSEEGGSQAPASFAPLALPSGEGEA